MQIGWATKNCNLESNTGVGDDQYGWAWDGYRRCGWFISRRVFSLPHGKLSSAAQSNPLDSTLEPHTQERERWKRGDVLGFSIKFLPQSTTEEENMVVTSSSASGVNVEEEEEDKPSIVLNKKRKVKVTVTSNGQDIGVQDIIDLEMDEDEQIYPAISFIEFQRCRFNFGNEPFMYKKPSYKGIIECIDAPDKTYSFDLPVGGPLHWAAGRGHREVMQLLLGACTDSYQLALETDTLNQVPLHKASEEGYVECVSALLTANKSCIRSQDKWRRDTLHNTILYAPTVAEADAFANNRAANTSMPRQSLEVVMQTLLSNSFVIPNQQDDDGNTPLHLAAVRGCKPVMGLLMAKGASLQDRNNEKATPFLFGIRNNLSVIKYLLKRGASIYDKDENGKTVLYAATINGEIPIFRYLLSKGARDESNDWGNTAFLLAAHNAYIDILQMLLEHGADVNQSDKRGRTALMRAAEMGNMETLTWLLNNNVNINKCCSEGNTALGYAAENGKINTLKYLAEQGMPVSTPNRHGQTPLLLASYGCSDVDMFKTLFSLGAKLTERDRGGNNALIYASLSSHLKVVKYLVAAGLDPGCRNLMNMSPLDCAAMHDHSLPIVKYLCNYVKQTPESLHTAVSAATTRGQKKNAEFLLSQSGLVVDFAELFELSLQAPDISLSILLLKKLKTTTLGLSEDHPSDSVDNLFNVLKIDDSITTLNLECRYITDTEVDALCNVLRHNKTLTSINLRSNPISLEGLKALLSVFDANENNVVTQLLMPNAEEVLYDAQNTEEAGISPVVATIQKIEAYVSTNREFRRRVEQAALDLLKASRIFLDPYVFMGEQLENLMPRELWEHMLMIGFDPTNSLSSEERYRIMNYAALRQTIGRSCSDFLNSCIRRLQWRESKPKGPQESSQSPELQQQQQHQQQ
eukprot:TRINITY_DN4023_c0_g2_i2.p1 TRINITY_DN4023_c0_g2~~TRINITY_DN4023_c0_g2_i2.p1  ORF type:complete len:918 (-),score=141.29 TRINITY_DN4023_c0_g2_i2:59-2812(-)